MSLAGFSFDTATSRAGDWEGEAAACILDRIEDRLVESCLAREGSTYISVAVFDCSVGIFELCTENLEFVCSTGAFCLLLSFRGVEIYANLIEAQSLY